MNQKFSPLISIIVPVYNREALIRETLRSIANQSYINFQCILVDDQSTDRTVEIIKDFIIQENRFELIERPSTEQKGAPTCRNIGLNRARGEFIQFFDSDDILLPTALEDKLRPLMEDSELQFVVSRTAFLMEDGQIDHPNQRLTYPQTFEEFLKNKTVFFTPGPLFRSSFLKQQRIAFDPSLARHQEFEFYSRLMSKMPNFRILDKVHCHYRMHSESIKFKSDQAGNLYYRKTKLKAIQKMNTNTEYLYNNAIKEAFWPYAITTLKVAVFNIKPRMVWYTLNWMLKALKLKLNSRK